MGARGGLCIAYLCNQALAAVVYADQLDPAIAPLLAPMDTLLFWTWAPSELKDLDLEAVEWTRRWIAEHGNRPLAV